MKLTISIIQINAETAFYIMPNSFTFVPRQGLNHVSETAHCEILSHYSNTFLVVNLDESQRKLTKNQFVRFMHITQTEALLWIKE